MRLVPAYILLAGFWLLPGCDPAIRADVNTGLEKGQRLTVAQRSRLAAAQRGEVIVEEAAYFGTRVEAKRGSRQGLALPRRVEGARGLRLSLAGQADVEIIAAAITTATGIPVNIRTRYNLSAGVIDVPIGTRMAARHEGPLSAFLDRLAARMDVAWSYDGTVITINRMVWRSWRIPLPTGITTVTDETRADGGMGISTTRSFDPWAELGARLAPLTPPPAQVILSPEAGRVSVFGPPSVQARAAKVLDDVQATASQRIAMEVAVYFVKSDKADEFSLALAKLGDGLAATAGTEGGGTLTLSRGSYTISFAALARSASVVDYRLGATTAQSGVIAPITVLNTRNYLRSVEAVTSEQGTNIELDVADLETGISITTLPRLIAPDQLQLALTIIQRELVELTEYQASNVKIQQPWVSERAIRTETLLAPGETLVVTGYEQDRAERGNRGMGIFRAAGLGGANRAARQRVRMYVLIRPSILSSRHRS